MSNNTARNDNYSSWLIYFLYIYTIEEILDNSIISKFHLSRKECCSCSRNTDSVTFLSQIPGWIEDALEIGDIRTGGTFCVFFTIFFCGEGFSIRLVEVPWFDIFFLVLYNHSICFIDEFADISRPQFITISEVLLKNIRIIRSIVWLSWELPICWIYIPVCIASSSYEYGLYLFDVIGIRDFGESLQIILEREFIHDEKFSAIIHDMESSSEFIVIVSFVLIPCRRPVPAGYFENCGSEADLWEPHFFLAEPEEDLAITIRFESEFETSLECSREVSERDDHRLYWIETFDSNRARRIREFDFYSRSSTERCVRRGWSRRVWIRDRSETGGICRGFSNACKFGIEIRSRTSSISDFSMSREIIGLEIFEESAGLSAISRTLTVSDGRFIEIDTIFLADVTDGVLQTIFLGSIDIIGFEIS